MGDDEVDGKEVKGYVYMLEEKMNGKAIKLGKLLMSVQD